MEPDAHVTAVIDLLLTIGYVDGTFHADEQKFIAGYINWLVENFATEPGAADRWRTKINQVYAALDAEIAGFVSEVVAQGDDSYMRTRLKVRAVALFRSFSPTEQEGALALLDRMIHADATVAPQEKELHDELVAHFRTVPPRFNFGRDQFRTFMQRVGCHTLIRGHEQVDDGFHTNFDVGGLRLHTLFSAGGSDNPDLPAESRYRSVKPMALSLYAGGGPARAVPWAVQYQPFTQAPNNGFYRY